MVTLDKTYFSLDSGIITVILRDDSDTADGIVGKIDSISISKIVGVNEYTYSIPDYDSVESNDHSCAVLTINPLTDANPDSESFPALTVDSILFVKVNLDGTELTGYTYNPAEFYSYRVALFNKMNETPADNTIQRDIIRLIFLENSISDAVSLGYLYDAVGFYNESRKIYLWHKTRYYFNEKSK